MVFGITDAYIRCWRINISARTEIGDGKRIHARRYRNRRLGDFLKELDLTEGRGTGIPTIQAKLAENGSPRAVFETTDDRLCFRNPGLLRLPIEQIYEGGNSKARNPRIQNMLRMIGFGENLGSGFPKIIAAWKETNWGDPHLLNKVELDEVELVLPVPSPKTAPATENATVKLNKTQMRILPILQANKFATYEEIAKQLDIERTTVWRNLDTLKKEGAIKRIGGDKNGYWELLINMEDCNQ